MNRIAGMALVILGLALLSQEASAQSNCKDAKGSIAEVYNGGDSSGGPLSHGGWLDGAMQFLYNVPGVYPTSDPNKITFGATFTLTTNRGVVKGKAVILYDIATAQGASMVNIDPAASTGVFAGATGLLFVNTIKGTVGPPPNYYLDLVGGQVCFAR